MKVQVTSTGFRYARICLSPLGLHGWADLYWQEYEGLSNDWRGSAEAYLLLCRAIELEFKAWHRQAGSSDGLIDRFRHDLMASYRALPKKHQILSVDGVEALERVNAFYLKQGFEDAEAVRVSVELPEVVDIGGLRGLAEKVLEHGDGLGLESE